MIRDLNPNIVQGVWIRKTKTFYYLETGEHRVQHPVMRVKRTLSTRGLLLPDIANTGYKAAPFKLMSLAEAMEKEQTIEPIYLNAGVRRQAEASEQAKKHNPWKS